MKKIIFVLLFTSFAFASTGGDSLRFPTTVTALADNDTFQVATVWKPLVDSLLSWGNGRIGGINLKSDAKLSQRTIDSTASAVTDWIYNYTRKPFIWSSSKFQIHNGRDIEFYLNDTTANQGHFKVVTDSTKKLFDISEDSVFVYRPLKCSTDVIGDNFIFDSLNVANITASGRITASSGKITGDSIYGVSAIVTPQGVVANSVNSVDVTATGTVSGLEIRATDSLVVTKGLNVRKTATLDTLDVRNFSQLGGDGWVKIYGYKKLITTTDTARGYVRIKTNALAQLVCGMVATGNNTADGPNEVRTDWISKIDFNYGTTDSINVYYDKTSALGLQDTIGLTVFELKP